MLCSCLQHCFVCRRSCAHKHCSCCQFQLCPCSWIGHASHGGAIGRCGGRSTVCTSAAGGSGEVMHAGRCLHMAAKGAGRVSRAGQGKKHCCPILSCMLFCKASYGCHGKKRCLPMTCSIFLRTASHGSQSCNLPWLPHLLDCCLTNYLRFAMSPCSVAG